MKKLLYPVQRLELDILAICLIFLIALFFSNPVFDLSYKEPNHRLTAYTGMFLVGMAAVLLTLIVWENLLFYLRLRFVEDGVKVCNPTRKNVIQGLLYAGMLLLFLVIYVYYPVNEFYFRLWFSLFATIPIVHKITYKFRSSNPLLKLTRSEIQFRNRRKMGRFYVKNIQYIRIIKGAKDSISKLRLGVDDDEVTIDLDEMNVDPFNDNITDYIKKNYTTLLKY